MEKEILGKQELQAFKYQMETLQKEKENLQNQLCKEKVKEAAKYIFEENSKETLNLREIENILKDLYFDIKNILE